MKQIIVTITDKDRLKAQDLELPNGIPIEQLAPDIVAALSAYSNIRLPYAFEAELLCVRTGKVLGRDTTLSSSGVMNGDILIIQ